jgi:hypothetical protein
MGNSDKEAELNKAVASGQDEFFSSPPAAADGATFGDPQADSLTETPSADQAETLPASENPIAGADTVEKPDANESARSSPLLPAGASLPATVLFVLRRYLEIAKKLLFSPFTFFKEMERTGGLKEPGIFLAVSAVGNGVISALLSLNFALLTRNSFFIALSCFVMSGLSYMMAKGMGSKCTFEVTFRVFAYCSCLALIGSIPGLNLLVPIAALVLYFLGLKEVLGVTIYQTCTIMFLVGFMQVILSLGQAMGH